VIEFKTIREFRCPFGIGVILAIALVLGCDLLCDLGVVSFSPPQPSHHAADTGHSHKEGHHSSDHHDSKAHSHPPHDLDTAKHDHDSTNKDGGCCDDLTQQFYSSLVSTASGQVSIVHAEAYKLISTLMFVDVSKISLTGNLPFTSIFEHPPNGPPPQTGRTIRVLFCSFLI
jgi:hypothetical protein